jgi:hypothetical protein
MARVLGLRVRKETADCGRFSVPGSDAVHAYAGVVEGETILQISGKVLARVNNLRVISHPHPFMLLGSDVLRGGRPRDSWNFTGLKVVTTGLNTVKACLQFEVEGGVVEVPLPYAPAGAINMMHSAIADVSSGQCLRRQF